MSLCLTGGGKLLHLATAAFTLAWTHSAQYTSWEEDWRVSGAGLSLMEARVKGHGGSVEPPAEARFDGWWWRWQSANAPVQVLVLRRSSITSDWRLCVAGTCRPVGELVAADPVALSGCPDDDAR
jgi:hypothetical protein